MKLLAFILASLVLALSIMPCADQDIAANNNSAKYELAKAKSGQQQNGKQQDDCSPFCQCTCCAGFSVNHFIASIPSIPSYIYKATASHLPAFVIEIALPIWQPPKLS